MKTTTAIDLALQEITRLYAGRVDANGVPSVMHPLQVAYKFVNDPALFLLALFHDVKEEFPAEAEVTLAKFPESLGKLVTIITRQPEENYDAYIDRIIASGVFPALIVKAADIATNLERIARFESKQSLKPRYEKALARLGSALVLDAVRTMAEEVDKPKDEPPPTVDKDNPLMVAAPETLQ